MRANLSGLRQMATPGPESRLSYTNIPYPSESVLQFVFDGVASEYFKYDLIHDWIKRIERGQMWNVFGKKRANA